MRAAAVLREVRLMLLAERIEQTQRDQVRDRLAALESAHLRDRVAAVETAARLEAQQLRAELGRVEEQQLALAVELELHNALPAAATAPPAVDWYGRPALERGQ